VAAVVIALVVLVAAAVSSLWWFKLRPQQGLEGGFGARPSPPVSVPNPAFAPTSTSHAQTESIVVMGSNQQSYAVPMEGEGEQTGILGASAGSLQDDANDLIPRPAQANAYELMQVTGAREHRSSAPIYSPPEPPPPPPGWVAGGGGADYTYIDEDAPDDGNSRAAIEYATVVDGVQLGSDLPGSSIYETANTTV